jgi:hypothetical protein
MSYCCEGLCAIVLLIEGIVPYKESLVLFIETIVLILGTIIYLATAQQTRVTYNSKSAAHCA